MMHVDWEKTQLVNLTVFNSGDVVVQMETESETIEIGTVTDIKYECSKTGQWEVNLECVILGSRSDIFSKILHDNRCSPTNIIVLARNEYGGATMLKFKSIYKPRIQGHLSAGSDKFLSERLIFNAIFVDHWVPVNVWDKEKEQNV